MHIKSMVVLQLQERRDRKGNTKGDKMHVTFIANIVLFLYKEGW